MTRLHDLETLRDNLLIWMDDAPVDRKAALVAQFRATITEIAELTPVAKKAGDPVDEIAARRSARGASAAPAPGRTRSDAR